MRRPVESPKWGNNWRPRRVTFYTRPQPRPAALYTEVHRMWQALGDWYYRVFWNIDRCGLGPDRWGEVCGGGTWGGYDYPDTY